jgi:hypothetical protein
LQRDPRSVIVQGVVAVYIWQSMFGLGGSHTVSRFLPENRSGKADLSDLLRRNHLTLPDQTIADIVSISVHHARKLARRAKKEGGGDLIDWRANLARSFESVVLAMVKARDGEVLGPALYCEEVKELLLESRVLFDASEIKVAVGTPIRCEEHHDNGLFTARVLESEWITLECMSLSTDLRSDNSYLCPLCARPIAMNHGGKDWFVCTGDEWVG